MKNLTKNDLVAHIMNLNSIIRFIDEKNCYDKVVEFFQITSELQDCSEQIKKLLPPLDGFEFHGLKSAKRKRSEINRKRVEAGLNEFLIEINKAGRNGHGRFGRRCGHNRTNPGENVTKNNIYFGDMTDGDCSFMGFISIYRAERTNDDVLQNLFRKHIVDFVKNFTGKFNIDWLM